MNYIEAMIDDYGDHFDFGVIRGSRRFFSVVFSCLVWKEGIWVGALR